MNDVVGKYSPVTKKLENNEICLCCSNFKYLSMKVSKSYSDEIVSDVVNVSKVQEKILQALSDLNGNVNATLVLEKFVFTVLLDNNNLEFLIRG